LIINHRISSTMHNEMNSASSQTEALDQFHMNVSCMVTLSCSRCSMKFERHCFGIHLHDQLKNPWTSLVDLAWLMIIDIMNVINFSNLTKMKFFKVQNNLNVVRNVAKMSRTPTFGSTNWLTPFTISVTMKNSFELVTTIEAIWNRMKTSHPRHSYSPQH
jgi:hypothetical protein